MITSHCWKNFTHFIYLSSFKNKFKQLCKPNPRILSIWVVAVLSIYDFHINFLYECIVMRSICHCIINNPCSDRLKYDVKNSHIICSSVFVDFVGTFSVFVIVLSSLLWSMSALRPKQLHQPLYLSLARVTDGSRYSLTLLIRYLFIFLVAPEVFHTNLKTPSYTS